MLLPRNSTMIPPVLLVGAATIPLTVLLLAQCTRYGALVPSRIVLVTAAAGGLLGNGGGLGALDTTLVLRGILVPAGHVAWTGAICAALWYLVETSHKARGAFALAAAYIGAIVLHTAWDATGGLAPHVAIGLLSVDTLLVLIIASHRAVVRRERAAASTGA